VGIRYDLPQRPDPEHQDWEVRDKRFLRRAALEEERKRRAMVEFGFSLPQHSDWETNLLFAQTCDRVGIDHIWTIDHLVDPPKPDRFLYEAWTLASALAGVTDHVKLGHLVLCNLFRPPSLLAKMAATLDHISGGRVILGIGAGYFPLEFDAYGIPFPDVGPRLQMLREGIEVCKALWTQSPATYKGTHYTVEDAYCEPRPMQRPHPPILIGGSGEKVLLKIVAEHASYWNNSPMTIDVIEHKIGVLQRHCEAIGREPAEIQISQMITLLIAETEAKAKRMLEDAQAVGFWGEAIVGTPTQAIEKIQGLVDRGVRAFQFGTRPDVPAEMVELFAAEVLPAFR